MRLGVLLFVGCAATFLGAAGCGSSEEGGSSEPRSAEGDRNKGKSSRGTRVEEGSSSEESSSSESEEHQSGPTGCFPSCSSCDVIPFFADEVSCKTACARQSAVCNGECTSHYACNTPEGCLADCEQYRDEMRNDPPTFGSWAGSTAFGCLMRSNSCSEQTDCELQAWGACQNR